MSENANLADERGPGTIRLTEDYLDFATGIGYEVGTVLVRMASGQYAPEGTGLGRGGCLASLRLLDGNYEAWE